LVAVVVIFMGRRGLDLSGGFVYNFHHYTLTVSISLLLATP
jgi:hypothetical protein